MFLINPLNFVYFVSFLLRIYELLTLVGSFALELSVLPLNNFLIFDQELRKHDTGIRRYYQSFKEEGLQ